MGCMPYRSQEARKAYDRDWKRRRRKATREGRAIPAPRRQELVAKTVREWPRELGGVLADWTADSLVVPEGLKRGQPFELARWQIETLDDAGDPDVQISVASLARRNGKSGLLSSVLAALLVPSSPLYLEGADVLATSLTGAIASALRQHTVDLLHASGLDQGLLVRKSPPPGYIQSADRSVTVRFLNASKATGHGMAADVALVDELGLYLDNQRALVSSMFASTAGRAGKSFVISIQGHSSMMQELIARADEPEVSVRLHAAPEGCPIDDVDAIRAANPSVDDGILDLRTLQGLARVAISNPADTLEFRRLHLNQRITQRSADVIVDPPQWSACEVEELPPREGPVALGVDLGLTTSFSAAAAYWPNTGRLEVLGGVAANPGLEDRGKSDGVGLRYFVMHQRGELWIPDDESALTIDIGGFLVYALSELCPAGPSLVLSDRFRQSEAQDVFRRIGMYARIEYRGLGYRDGNEDVHLFQRAVLEQRIKTRESLLMTSAITESEVIRDVQGNMKLARVRGRGRIDALSAATLAVGAGERMRARPRIAPRWVIV